VSAAALILSLGGMVHANGSFPDPTGAVLLTITDPDAGEKIALDRAGLESLPRRSFETTTIWTEGVKTFEGVPLSAILNRMGISEGKVRLTAVNDYSVEIPVEEVLQNDPLIADLVDGQEMSLRDKGPLWLVYPYDSDTRYQNETFFARSIWQLNRLEAHK
jgi:hypothetical protein